MPDLKPKYVCLVVCDPAIWAKGETYEQALLKCHRIAPRRKLAKYLCYWVSPETVVNQDGSMSRDPESPAPLLEYRVDGRRTFDADGNEVFFTGRFRIEKM